MKVQRKRPTPAVEALAGAEAKLAEAAFYLRLMDRVERTGKALVEEGEPALEYGFLLSALLNSCYSVVSYLAESEPDLKNLADQFKREHPEYYAHAVGLRSISVHVRPVTPAHHGYVPQPGFNVVLRHSEEDRWQPRRGFAVGLDFSKGERYYYVSGRSPQNAISDTSALHLAALKKLVVRCAALRGSPKVNT